MINRQQNASRMRLAQVRQNDADHEKEMLDFFGGDANALKRARSTKSIREKDGIFISQSVRNQE